MATIKVKLDQKDPKKGSVKFYTDKATSSVKNIYISNDAVEKLGNPDEVTVTISAD
jgi:hypothetical protein